MISLRKANKSDLHNLDIIRNNKLRELHKSRLKKQAEQKAEYLIAFNGKKPIGHLFVNYKSKRDWHNCPILEDLYVKDEEREKGIGKTIMLLTEGHLKKLGFHKVGIDVETHEVWIRKFYKKLGYKLVSGPHKLIWINKDAKNKRETEIVYHLRKTL